MPSTVSIKVSRRIDERTCLLPAPRAMRIPISLSSLRDEEGDHSIEANGSEQRGENSEETREGSHQPFGEEGFPDLCFEHSKIQR